ncbi:MAG: hypothetical protein ABI197_02430 [Granulicella sp.]
MILPVRYSSWQTEDWKDVWAWQAFSLPSSEASIDLPSSSANDSLDRIATEPLPSKRWGTFLWREVYLFLPALSVYLVLFPLRRLISNGFQQLIKIYMPVVAGTYLLATAALLIFPPCELISENSYGATVREHLLLWQRGNYTLDYGALILEELAIFALASALYVALHAFNRRQSNL